MRLDFGVHAVLGPRSPVDVQHQYSRWRMQESSQGGIDARPVFALILVVPHQQHRGGCLAQAFVERAALWIFLLAAILYT